MTMRARGWFYLVGIVACGLLRLEGVEPAEKVKKLASGEFAEREKASEELKEWVLKNKNASPDVIYKIWNTQKNPEAKARCLEVLKQAVIRQKFGKGQGFVGIVLGRVKTAGKGGLVQPGVLVVSVSANTPAQKEGLQQGDIILGVDALHFSKLPKRVKNRLPVSVDEVFREYIKSKTPGDVIVLQLKRGGAFLTKKLKLMRRPGWANARRRSRNRVDEEEAYFKSWLEKKRRK